MVLENYSLCTCEFLYWLPDRPSVLAPPLMLQMHDLVPDHPVLRRFLAYWQKNLDGRLHSVRVASQRLIRPTEYRAVGTELVLH
jgi:uncharacterized protein Usg